MIELAPNELATTAPVSSGIASELQIFPADYSWLFVSTHENFSFLGGSKAFVGQFEARYPTYPRFDETMNYLGWGNGPEQKPQS